MPKLIFTKTFQYRPSAERRITKVYQASKKPQLVNEECFAQAIGQGYAYEAPAPKKKADAGG